MHALTDRGMTLADLFTDDVVKLIGTGLGAGFLYLLGRITNAATRARIDAIVDAAIPIAFSFVEELARKTPNKVDDKVALGLASLKAYLDTKGLEITEAQKDRARLVFSALHAESLARAAVPTFDAPDTHDASRPGTR